MIKHNDFNVCIEIGEPPNKTKEFETNIEILTRHSPYFKAALSIWWAQKRPDEERLIFKKPNVSVEAFQILLDFMNLSLIDLSTYSPTTWLDLLLAADEMLFDNVLNHVQFHFLCHPHQWISSLLVQVLNAVVSRPTCTDLRDYCLKDAIEKNPSLLFNSPDFNALNEKALEEIVKCDKLGIREIDLWKKVVIWGIANVPNSSRLKNTTTYQPEEWEKEEFWGLKEKLAPLLQWIRFFDISLMDFEKEVRPFSSILPEYLIGDFVRWQLTDKKPLYFEPKPPRQKYIPIESEIITSGQAALIASWIEGKFEIEAPLYIKFCLIYRASTHGRSIKTFYNKCKNVGPTIIVVKLKNSKQIIGGYNPLNSAWKHGRFSSARGDRTGFLFSFTDRQTLDKAKICKILPKKRNCGIYDHPGGGPCFGMGPDLWICTGLEKKIGQTVEKTYIGNVRGTEGYFYWDDCEIFQVLKKRG
ncbi:hypothetical protein G9A89_001875 [Geosiphon pyriformis]|nr:hypothetical protein G9A89_001875 [Geosiphon pyriformis]